MRRHFIAIAMYMTVTLGGAHASTLFAMLVSTSELTGSGAVDISPGTQVGIAMMDKTLGQAAALAGMSYRARIVKGESFLSTTVNKNIENLNPDQDDVVVFYYAGHGYHDVNEKDIFPAMYIPTTSPNTYGGIQEIFVRDKIQAKGPHLVITIFDSCNVLITGLPLNPRFATPPSLPNTSLARQNMTKLMAARGTVTIAGAKVGTEGWVSMTDGGLFTRQFLNVFPSVLRNGVGSWSELAAASSNVITPKAGTVQQPVFEVSVQ